MSASSNVRPDVGQFFERFEKASATLDVVALEEMFEEQFLNLDPRSAAPFTRAALIAALPMREKMFASIGAARAALVGMSESPLDDCHTLVHTSWAVDFPEGVADEALTLTSTFLLRRASGGSWRIVVYLNHQVVVDVIRTRSAHAENPDQSLSGGREPA